MAVTNMGRSVWMLIRAARPADWPRYVDGVADLLMPVLKECRPLPGGLVDAALAGRRTELLTALASNVKLLDAEPGLRDRLAATGSPGVAGIALRSRGWTLAQRRLVLSSARPEEPGWEGPGGVVDGLLSDTDLARLRAAVGCPFPDTVRRALRVGAARLTTAEQLRALLTLHTLEGTAAAGAALAAAHIRPEVAAGGPADLARRTQVAEGTAGALAELRDSGFAERAEHLALRVTLDWPAVLAAHAADPLPDDAVTALVGRPDCPQDVVLAFFATSAGAVAPAVPVSEALLLAPSPARGAAKTVRVLARNAVEAGIGGPALLLEHLRPALPVLDAIRLRPEDPAAGAAADELTAALEKLVAEHLGADVAAWRAVRGRLKAFKGTVAELLAAPSPAPVSWPDAEALPDLSKPTSVSGLRAAFLALLDAAPTPTQLALLAHVDDRTAHDLLAHGRWRPEWAEHVIEHGPPAARLALAARGSLGAAAIERLMTLDDPVINGQLFQRAGATYAQRTRLLSGRPCGPGRTDPVPLDPAFRKRLLARTGGWSGRDALDCPDPQLQLHILRHVRLRGRIPQLHLLAGVWRRQGPAAVAKLVEADLKPVNYTRNPFQPATKRTIKSLLAQSDAVAALAGLQAEVDREETAEAQIAALRTERTDHTNLFAESHDWHWPELLAEHRREPFDDKVVGVMGTSRGAPEEFREQARRVLLPWNSDEEALLCAGTPAEQVLAERVRTVSDWLQRALITGHVTPAVALRHGHPAATILLYLSMAESGRTRAEGARLAADIDAAVAALLAETIGDNPDAWVLTLRMLGGFAGPLPELLATVAAVVS